MLKKIKLPIIPILIFAAFNLWFFEDEFAHWYTLIFETRCSEELSTTYESDSEDSDGPHIKPLNHSNFKTDIPEDFIAEYEIWDDESEVDMSTLSVEIYDAEQEILTVKDNPENLTYRKEDGKYILRVKPLEKLDRKWSIKWEVRVCDCSGNLSENYTLNAVCDNDLICAFNTVPAYYLQYILWFIFVFGPTFKVVKFGVVYNSVTKTPIPRAAVRLYKDDKLIKTSITNINGVFNFTPSKGKYTINVHCAGYTFPSKLKPKKSDGSYQNLYYGGEIVVKEDKEQIRVTIPLDPKDSTPQDSIIKNVRDTFSSTFSRTNSYALLISAFLPIIVWGFDIYHLHFQILNLALFGIKQIFIMRNKGRFGVVKSADGKRVPGLDIGIFDKKYDRLVDTATTDQKGRYQFMVPGGSYYIKSMDPEYTLLNVPEGENGIQVGRKTEKDLIISKNFTVREIAESDSKTRN